MVENLVILFMTDDSIPCCWGSVSVTVVDSGDLLFAIVDGLSAVVVQVSVGMGARVPVVVAYIESSCRCLLAELLVNLDEFSSI